MTNSPRALDSIKQHVAAGETEPAWDVYVDLLNVYPALQENEALIAEVRTISAAEKSRVTVRNDEMPGSKRRS